MIRYILAAILSGLMLAGCSHDDPQGWKPKVPARMTLLVYMAANNSMGRDGKDDDDINEMLSAARSGALGDGRVLVYRAEYYGERSQKLLEVTPDSVRTLKVYADTEVPATDPARLRQVIADTRALAPADGYGLVLWSHSLGWTNSPSLQSPSLRSFGQDQTTGRMMTISEMGQALDPDSFRFIYFDCCLMGSVEVVYELRHAAPVMGVSVTEVPYDGMPYDKTLPLLLDGSRNALTAIACTMIEHYGTETYGKCPVSAVLIDTSALDDLAATTASVYANALPLPEGFAPQEFYTPPSRYPDYRFYDFGEYVETICPDPDLMEQWRADLAQTVVFEAHSDYVWWHIPINRHCGLSTRILFSADDPAKLGYDRLKWFADVSSSIQLNQNP